MPFTYTNRRGNSATVNTNPHEIMDAYLNDGVTWVGMRQRFGLGGSRMYDIRQSPEWAEAVGVYANAHGHYRRALEAQLCWVPGQRATPRRSQSASVNDASATPSAVLEPGPPSYDFPSRQFGVELEVVSKLGRRAICDRLQANDVLAFVGYYDSPSSRSWKVGTDTSIRITPSQERNGYVRTMEIVSPPLSGWDGLREVERVLGVLGGQVSANMSCGQHVHVDLSGVSLDELRRLSAAWLKHEWLVNSLIPESRRYRNNSFCRDNARELRRFDGEEFGAQQRAELNRVSRLRSVRRVREVMEDGISKYRKFNLTSMVRHGTVEFRHWSGTGDAEKVLRHIQMSVGFVSEFLEADMVRAVETRPSLWEATSELVTRVSRWVGDAQFPYYWVGRQAALGAAA